ncbi:MAG: YegS/Rv2252/BmrU family lipid kinase [Gemmatimonadaceae bacterium]
MRWAVPSARLLWNPASGRGRGARAIGAIRAAFAAHGLTDLRCTEHSGDETRLVHEAIADGIGTIVVAGGDGTWSKCAIALARAGAPARMAFLAAGTGNDFAKNIRAPAHDAAAMARLVATGGTERRVDLGRVDDHWFLNVAGFGFDVAVLRRSTRLPLLRGPALYVAAALTELLGYPGLDARVSTPGGDADAEWTRHLLLVFSNGREFGGTFRIAPDARVDDGKLDAVLVGDGTRLGRLPLLARAVRGTHRDHPSVRALSGARFTVTFRESPWCELDGELRRAESPTVEIASLPGVLRVLEASPAGN